MGGPRSASLAFQTLNLAARSLYSIPTILGAVTRPVSQRSFSTTSGSNGPQNSQPKSGFNPTKSHRIALNSKDEGIAQIDGTISIEYPENDKTPQTPVIQGHGGVHFKRTLEQFSLENKVSVVTGGASGIGLAISQAIVASGSHLAIVDMNRNHRSVGDEAHRQAETLLKQFKIENPGLKE